MNSHLTSAKSCSWYVEEKLRGLGIDDVNHGVSPSSLITVKYRHVRKDGTDGKMDTDTEDGGVHGG